MVCLPSSGSAGIGPAYPRSSAPAERRGWSPGAGTSLRTLSSARRHHRGTTLVSEGGSTMSKKLLVVAAALSAAAPLALWSPWASGVGATTPGRSAPARANACSGYEPHLDPRNFVKVIDNPFFPLP